MIEIDFCTYETMDPVAVDGEGVSEDFQRAGVGGASEKNDLPARSGMEVQLPSIGDRNPRGSSLDTGGVALPGGGDVSLRSLPEISQSRMDESIPDFGLPAPVEAFDGRLESRFVGGCKDRRDVETQAQPDDAADGIAMLSGTCEAVVVVELSKAWQSAGVPVLQQRVDDGRGRDLSFGPDRSQTAMQRDSRQNRQMRATANGEPFDGVERVQFAGSRGHPGQIPAGRRRRAADSLAAIEDSMTFENSPDRSPRRKAIEVLQQFAMDGVGPELSEVADFLESATYRENTSLDGDGCPPSLPGRRGVVSPVDAIEALQVGTSHPVLDGGEGHGKASSHRTHRLSRTDGGDQIVTICRREFFGSCQVPGRVLDARYRIPVVVSQPPQEISRAAVRERNSSRATPSFRSAPAPSSSPLNDLKVLALK